MGGSDAVNAVTWRLALSPAGRPPPDLTGSGARTAQVAPLAGSVVLEAYDRPGMVLTLGERLKASSSQVNGNGSPAGEGQALLLASALAAANDSSQRWILRPVLAESGCAPMANEGGVVALESMARPDVWVRTAAAPPGAERKGASLEAGPGRSHAAIFQLMTPLARYPPLALWASSNLTCAGRDAPGNCREHYLMLPLRDVIDETYAAHLCVLPSGGARAPDFCHPDVRPWTQG